MRGRRHGLDTDTDAGTDGPRLSDAQARWPGGPWLLRPAGPTKQAHAGSYIPTASRLHAPAPRPLYGRVLARARRARAACPCPCGKTWEGRAPGKGPGRPARLHVAGCHGPRGLAGIQGRSRSAFQVGTFPSRGRAPASRVVCARPGAARATATWYWPWFDSLPSSSRWHPRASALAGRWPEGRRCKALECCGRAMRALPGGRPDRPSGRPAYLVYIYIPAGSEYAVSSTCVAVGTALVGAEAGGLGGFLFGARAGTCWERARVPLGSAQRRAQRRVPLGSACGYLLGARAGTSWERPAPSTAAVRLVDVGQCSRRPRGRLPSARTQYPSSPLPLQPARCHIAHSSCWPAATPGHAPAPVLAASSTRRCTRYLSGKPGQPGKPPPPLPARSTRRLLSPPLLSTRLPWTPPRHGCLCCLVRLVRLVCLVCRGCACLVCLCLPSR